MDPDPGGESKQEKEDVHYNKSFTNVEPNPEKKMNNQVLYVCFKSLFLLFLPSLKASGTGNFPLFFLLDPEPDPHPSHGSRSRRTPIMRIRNTAHPVCLVCP